MKQETIIHPIPPLYREDSQILILGSFPSVKSREAAFFYGHPQNRFWKVMAAVFGDTVPADVQEKRAFLIRHRVAAWDVIHSCTITGSSDASIRDVVPNDLTVILDHAPIRQIFVNGKTAHKMYRKYIEPVTGRPAVCLPSTSPANAAWNLEKLTEAWKVCAGASLVIFSSVQDHKAPVDLLEHENARHEMRESEVRELPADTRSSEKGRGRSQ